MYINENSTYLVRQIERESMPVVKSAETSFATLKIITIVTKIKSLKCQFYGIVQNLAFQVNKKKETLVHNNMNALYLEGLLGEENG